MKPPVRRQPARRPSAPRKTKTPARSEPEERVVVTGAVPERVSQMRGSTIGLVTILGEFENGDDVLIPLVDWQLFGKGELSADIGDGEIGEELSSHLVGLDNMAFVVNRISQDLRSAVRQLVAQSRGGIAPLRSRTDYTARMLRNASDQLRLASSDLRTGLLEEEEEAQEIE